MPMMPEGEPWERNWRVESPVGMPGFSMARFPFRTSEILPDNAHGHARTRQSAFRLFLPAVTVIDHG
jgi:hypothetical protein